MTKKELIDLIDIIDNNIPFDEFYHPYEEEYINVHWFFDDLRENIENIDEEYFG